MSEERDGFLNRWSRLKRQTVEPVKPAAPEAVEDDKTSEGEAVPFDPTRLEIPLPSLDDLKPGDTLIAFMQKGVPEALRNAALRKMWALDPMVRDFKSEALDYAWDWNTPGGVPGGGSLGPADRVQEVVESLFRPDAPSDDRESGSEPADDPELPRLAETPEPDFQQNLEPEEVESSKSEAKPTETAPKKRHGGALPQV